MNHRRFSALAIAFVLQNVAVGTTYGAYGLLVDPISTAFSGSHSIASLGISLISLVIGLSAPLVGLLVDRWSVRGTVIGGCLLAAAGFVLAAFANSMVLFLFAFGAVAGAGVSAMGVLPASKIVAVWFPESTGKAVGVISIPLLVALGPPLFGYLIATLGWRSLPLVFAVVMVLLIPLAALLRTLPPGVAAPATDFRPAAATSRRLRGVFGEPRFWWLVVVDGLLMSSAIVLITHIAAYASSVDISLSHAALLLSVQGAASMVGAIVFGWLADRIGPLSALAINATAQALLWLGVAGEPGFSILAILVGGLGLCGGGIHPTVSALIARGWGQHRFASVQGQLGMMIIPFSFGMPPLIGWLYDIAGNYRFAFTVEAAACGLALALLVAGAYRSHARDCLPDH